MMDQGRHGPYDPDAERYTADGFDPDVPGYTSPDYSNLNGLTGVAARTGNAVGEGVGNIVGGTGLLLKQLVSGNLMPILEGAVGSYHEKFDMYVDFGGHTFEEARGLAALDFTTSWFVDPIWNIAADQDRFGNPSDPYRESVAVAFNLLDLADGVPTFAAGAGLIGARGLGRSAIRHIPDLDFDPISAARIARHVGHPGTGLAAARQSRTIPLHVLNPDGHRLAAQNHFYCFVAGTKVHTDQGLKNIEEIKVGDRVLSRDDHTGKQGYKPVTATFTNQTDELYHLTFRRLSDEELVELHRQEQVKREAKDTTQSLSETDAAEAATRTDSVENKPSSGEAKNQSESKAQSRSVEMQESNNAAE